jgi:hypothetical protein
MVAEASYARPLLRGLFAGGGLKLIDEDVDSVSAVGAAVDLGLLYRPPVPGLSAGLSLQNLGPPVKLGSGDAPLPLIARAGAAWRGFDGAVLFSAEGDAPGDGPPVAAFGAEVDIDDRFFPRAGWRYDSVFNPWTLGFGLKYGSWGLDLSAVPYGDLGLTWRGAAQISFGGPGARLEATQPYASAALGRLAVLKADLNAPDTLRAWAVYIYDSARPPKIVRMIHGSGPPQGPVEWDGRDKAGNGLPEGVYWAALTGRYESGQAVASPYVRLEVGGSAPVVALSIDDSSVNPDAAGEAFVPTSLHPLLKSGRAIQSWSLEILDPQGAVFRRLSGAGPPPDTLVWDGKGDQGDELISAQVYGARLVVTDAFGNTASSAPLGFNAVFHEPDLGAKHERNPGDPRAGPAPRRGPGAARLRHRTFGGGGSAGGGRRAAAAAADGARPGADGAGDRAAFGARGPDPSAQRARAQAGRHLPQQPGHHRLGLPRRSEGAARQPRRAGLQRRARGPHRANGGRPP